MNSKAAPTSAEYDPAAENAPARKGVVLPFPEWPEGMVEQGAGGVMTHGRRMILMVGFLAALLILFAAITAAYSLRESTRREWSAQMSSLSLILAEQASQTMFSAHTVLDSLSDVVKQARLEDEQSYRTFVSAEARHRLLVDKTDSNPIIDVATFVSSEGRVLNFTRSFPPPPINLSDRDYFKAHRDDASIDTFTSVPVRNKGNGKWVFYITRRVNNSKGEMLGLILVGVSVEAFSKFYERVGSDLGEGASLSLYRNDFTLMTRWPFVDDLVGKKNLTSVTKHVVGDRGLKNDVVITNAPRMTEGNRTEPRMVAPRALDRYPFIVTPVITEQLYLRNWRSSLIWIVATAGLSLLLLFFGMRSLLRADRKIGDELAKRVRAQASLRAAHEQLETRVAERTAELTREIVERESIQQELGKANVRVAAISHRAGMAEVANSVLHNVGNVLNSVSVSAQLLGERLMRTPLADLPRATALLREHEQDIATYLTANESGRALPGFLDLLAQQWRAEHDMMLAETQQLKSNIQHIKDIVSRQQSLSGQSGVTESFCVRELTQDALVIHASALERSSVRVIEEYEDMPPWLGDRSKVAQIVLNMVVNAEEALVASDAQDRVLSIHCGTNADGLLEIRISDNGIGMTPEVMDKLFGYGFTTKDTGHGFGLHASALAAQEMGGALRAVSEGHDRGATFILTLPRAATP